MSFDLLGLLIIIVVAAAFVGLWFVGKKVSFMYQMLIALGGGLILGVIIQLIWPIRQVAGKAVLEAPVEFAFQWINVVKTAYGNLLQLMVMPLVVVAIISGILKASDSSAAGNKIGKGAAVAIATLMITCAIAATLSMLTTLLFNGIGFSMNAKTFLGGDYTGAGREESTFVGTISGIFAAKNVLAAFSENTVLPIMFLSLVFGLIIAGMKKDDDYKESGGKVHSAINVAYEFVMGLVDFIIGLAPYGVLAYILSFGATTAFQDYIMLGTFVVASYVAMLAMWIVHFVIMFLCGVTPGRFFKKCGKSMIMAFSTRSSMATLPTTIKNMEDLGVEPTLATFSGTFSTCVGQNGCGGTYPAMVGTMILIMEAGGVVSAIPITQIIMLVFVTTLCSLGIAGVGGGATAAGLMLFGAMGWASYIPIIGTLFSVEALIDMGRTALNVSGGHVSAIVSGRLTGSLNLRGGIKQEEPKAA